MSILILPQTIFIKTCFISYYAMVALRYSICFWIGNLIFPRLFYTHTHMHIYNRQRTTILIQNVFAIRLLQPHPPQQWLPGSTHLPTWVVAHTILLASLHQTPLHQSPNKWPWRTSSLSRLSTKWLTTIRGPHGDAGSRFGRECLPINPFTILYTVRIPASSISNLTIPDTALAHLSLRLTFSTYTIRKNHAFNIGQQYPSV